MSRDHHVDGYDDQPAVHSQAQSHKIVAVISQRPWHMRPAEIEYATSSIQRVVEHLAEAGTEMIWCGFAPGIETLAGIHARRLGLALHAWLPYEGESSSHRWNDRQRRAHRSLIKSCVEVDFVSTKRSLDAYTQRNAGYTAADAVVLCSNRSPVGATADCALQVAAAAVPAIVIDTAASTTTWAQPEGLRRRFGTAA
jgi:hypothetical protein